MLCCFYQVVQADSQIRPAAAAGLGATKRRGDRSMAESGARMRERRDDFRWFLPMATRWMDNDAYGHMNNVMYYSFYDTAVNRLLIDQGLLDLAHGSMIGVVAETQCRFHVPVAFPEAVEAGVRVGRIGNSSVRYEVALFRESDPQAAADGHFVHVYVDRMTGRPTPIPDHWRSCLRHFQI
jgi:acyl-CoA thioester hydrolase